MNSLSREAIEKLPEPQKQYIVESELLKRHLDIQQKISQKTKYSIPDQSPSVDPIYESLQKSLREYKQLNTDFYKKSDNFESKVRSLYIRPSEMNLLFDLHN